MTYNLEFQLLYLNIHYYFLYVWLFGKKGGTLHQLKKYKGEHYTEAKILYQVQNITVKSLYK